MATTNRGLRRWLDGIALATCLLTSTSAASAGFVLEVVNKSKDDEVLSDLIAMGANGARKVILEPNNPKDDITIQGNRGTRLFDAGFEVTSYIISRLSGKNEVETSLFNVTQVHGKDLGFLEDPSTGTALYASLDFNTAAEPLSDGTLVTFSNGLSSLLPGWFVGTSIDLNTGVVSDPFTGTAESLAGLRWMRSPSPPRSCWPGPRRWRGSGSG